MSDPILFKANACPICGGDVMSYESMEGGSFTDGEAAFCARDCGWFGSVSVAEDGGDAFPSSACEIEPIVDLLTEAKEEAARLAKDLGEAVEKRPRWIKCSERMPDPGEDAYVVHGTFYNVYGVFDYTMRNGAWIFESQNGNDMTRHVTHWMPLPAPPTDEAATEKTK